MKNLIGSATALISALALGGCIVSNDSTTSASGRNTPAATAPSAASGAFGSAGDYTGTVESYSFAQLPDGAVATTVVLGAADQAPMPAQVVSFGQSFPAGVVTRQLAARIAGATLPTQLDVKRRHADGSVRHAVVTVAVPSAPADARRDLELVGSSSPAPGGVIDAASAIANGFDARVEVIDAGVTYTVGAAELLRGGAERWLSGPVATEYRVAGRPMAGATAHPALYVLFDVRFYSPLKARVSIAVENSFAPDSSNRTYDVRVRIAGRAEPLYEKSALEHFYHSRWRQIAWWGLQAPNVVAMPDPRTLAEAAAIPRYDPTLVIAPAAIDDLVGRWERSNREPLGNGIIVGAMPMAGGRWDIGLLPTWTALALLSRDPRAYRAMLGTGDLAASFSIHIRDRATLELFTIDAHPTASIHSQNPAVGLDADPADRLVPCNGCASPYIADLAHQPSLAYVPYLVTGDAFYWDELKFWANHNFLQVSARDYQGRPNRGYDRGYLYNNEVRGQAWSLRTLGHAAWIAPEADPHRAYFEAKLANNLEWYAANAPGSNPFGWWGTFSVGPDGRPQPQFAADAADGHQPWQHDFLVVAFDQLLRMGYTQARTTRDWLAGWTTARFTRPAEYNPNEGDAYVLAVRGAGGRTYASLAEIYANSFANRTTPPPTALSSLDCPYCYAAIARAALAGPVRDRLTQSGAAHSFIGAQLIRRDIFQTDPTWAIVP